MNSIINPRTGLAEHYVSLALFTAAPLKGRMNIVHALLGTAGELLETHLLISKNIFTVAVDSKDFKTKLIKEVGDILWFLALQHANTANGDVEAACAGFDTAASLYLNQAGAAGDGFMRGIEILETIDRMIAYSKKEACYEKATDDENLYPLFANAWAYVARIVKFFGLDFEEILRTNIEKLYARYDGGAYTQAAATEHNSQ